MNPSLRSESGGRDNHAMAPENSALQRNNSTDRAPYTDSETSEESSGHTASSGTAEFSTSWPRRKTAQRPQQHNHSPALQLGQLPTTRHQPLPCQQGR